MKYKKNNTNQCIYVILTLLLIACSPSVKKEVHLFRILENDKYGFIDVKGRVVIPPKFLSADNFSEGLANARITGTYGYIDTTGAFVIPPQFDYATPYSEGLAIVYKEGLPFFIDKKGQQVFANPYKELEPFKNGRAKVQTASKKFGFINTKGQLIIDTVYANIGPFTKGRAVVEGEIKDVLNKKNNGKYGTGVIDSLGKYIIPYGKCNSIADLEGGCFRVKTVAEPWDTLEGYTSMEGFYDRNGKVLFTKEYPKKCWLDGDMHNGLAKINLYQYWLPEEEGVYSSANSYEGFVDINGNIVINNSKFERVYDFHNDRAFVENSENYFFIINTKGQLVSKDSFTSVINEGFENGRAAVKKGDKYGIINTDGKFILAPQFNEVEAVDFLNGFIFFTTHPTNENEKYFTHFGIANLKGDTIFKSDLENFDRRGFVNGLLCCVIEGNLTYINESGQMVWQEKSNKTQPLVFLNIDYKSYASFYASSKRSESDLGGFGGSDNGPRVVDLKDNFIQNQLSLVVGPEALDTFQNKYKGHTVYLVNTTKNDIGFRASDSRLYMKVQAKDAKGQWRDIEYFLNSWCGNSHHQLTLEPNQYWMFVTPHYEGDFKTKLRIELTYIDPSIASESRLEQRQLTIYSNEYDSGINPAQFWRTEDYFSSNLMDPY